MRLYLSHRITSPTPEGQKLNCDAAIAFAKGLRHHFPDVEFYVPAESEPFVSKAHESDMLTVEQILEIDCQIILTDCQGVIFYAPYSKLSSGMQIEYNYCQLEHIPWIIVKDLAIEMLSEFIKQVGETDE